MLIDHNHNVQMSMNANASASNNQTGYIAWRDTPVNASQGMQNFPSYGANYFTLNGTVVTTVMPAPPAGFIREAVNFQLVNNDNATDKLIVQVTNTGNASNNTVIYAATQVTLANWVYIEEIGWKNQSAAGLSL